MVSAGFLFLAATAVAYGLTWSARLVAPRLGLVDRPDGGRKIHERATPLMGGVAIFTAIAVFVCMGFSWPWSSGTSRTIAGVMLSGICYLALGVWDDRYPLRARTKFAGQALAAIPFMLICGVIDQVTLFGFVWHAGALAIPFTVLWLAACVNIVNLLDGHDGLAGTIGLIAVGTLGALTWMSGHFELAMFCFVVGGAIAGFLVHNWPPAKIFLGDAGSMTIGFFIGALSMEAAQKSAATFTLVTPLAVLCVPMFDTIMAILRRKLSGRSIGEADRGHIHHRLQDSGFSRLQTLLVISGLCLATAVAAIIANWLHRDSVSAVMCASLLLVVVASGLFGDREMLLVFRHVQAVSSLVPGAGRAFGTRLLLAKLRDANVAERERFFEILRRRFATAGGVGVRIVASRFEPPLARSI